eukprot:566497_1
MLLIGPQHHTDVLGWGLSQNEWVPYFHPGLSWTRKLPDLDRYASVITRDERHVLFFGGKYEYRDGYEYSDDIYIMDLKRKQVRWSRIRCPNKSDSFKASIMRKDETLIISGFLRGCCAATSAVCVDIISSIQDWYCRDFIHLIDDTPHRRGHWMLSVDVLFDKLNITQKRMMKKILF